MTVKIRKKSRQFLTFARQKPSTTTSHYCCYRFHQLTVTVKHTHTHTCSPLHLRGPFPIFFFLNPLGNCTRQDGLFLLELLIHLFTGIWVVNCIPHTSILPWYWFTTILFPPPYSFRMIPFNLKGKSHWLSFSSSTIQWLFWIFTGWTEWRKTIATRTLPVKHLTPCINLKKVPAG